MPSLRRLERQTQANARLLRRQAVRVAAAGGGKTIRFVELDADAVGTARTTGNLYSKRQVLLKSGVTVATRGDRFGYYFGGQRYACQRTPHPLDPSIEHYTIFQGGAWYVSGVLLDPLLASSAGGATLEIAPGVTVEVIDNWGANPPDQARQSFGIGETEYQDVLIALAGDRIGAQWRSVGPNVSNWRWELSCHICNEDPA